MASQGAGRVRVEPGVYRRPDGVFVIGFRDAIGKQRWRRVDGGIRAARAALAEAKVARARGERVAVDPRLRFEDAAQAWLEARVVRLRPATQEAYGAALKHLLRPEHFGRARLADVTAGDVARYISAQQRAVPPLKGWTIKGHLTVLSAVFTFASRHLGFVGPNPVGLLDREERPSTDDEKEKRILTAVELGRLLAAVDEPYRVLFELGAETGARIAEVLGLVWADVDLEAETVTFAYQLDRRGMRQPLKTKGSRRCIEVTSQVVSRLRTHKLSSGHSKAQDLVFSTAAGTGHGHANIGGRVLRRAVKAAGLEAELDAAGKVVVPAPTFHALRHTHASRLIAAGWDIVEVSSRLGHSDVATTQRTYAHEFDAAGRTDDRRRRLAALYGAASTEQAVGALAGAGGVVRADASTTAVRALPRSGNASL